MPENIECCTHCQNTDWCQRRGCLAWNDQSRHDYDALKRRAEESNREIDELEKLFGSVLDQ